MAFSVCVWVVLEVPAVRCFAGMVTSGQMFVVEADAGESCIVEAAAVE